MNPTFSIIIPTFNSANTIHIALDSILRQTFDNWEVLIMDGVSSDNTLDVIRELNDNRIHIYSEPDSGIYDAMNKGIKQAKGEWVYFLGSDDSLYADDVLEKIAVIARKTKYKVLYGNVLIKGEAGWAKDGTIYAGEFTLNKLLDKNICHQALFYKKTCYKDCLYNLKYTVCADYDLNLKLWSKYKFGYIDLCIATFNGGGFSKVTEDKLFSIDRESNFRTYYKYWQLYPEYKKRTIFQIIIKFIKLRIKNILKLFLN